MAREANKVILVGHDETKDSIRATADTLKSMGMVPSCYFNEDIDRVTDQLNGVGLVLVGLSRAGREVSSKQYERERKLFERISKMHEPIPCGVIRDCDGYISAAYLTTYGHLVRLVFTDRQDGQLAPLELFKNFRDFPVDHPQMIAMVVAPQVRTFLHVTPVTV